MNLLDVRLMANVVAEPLQWVWQNRIPRRKLNLFVGDPEVGKSLFLLDLAARFSSGAPMPDGSPGLDKPGNVLLLCAEDDPADTIKPRLQAAGADLGHILIATEVLGEGSKREWFSAERHFDALESALSNTGRPWLVGFDPMQGFVGRIDANRDNEVRAVLGRFSQLCTKYDATFAIIMHLNKGVGLPSMYRTGGSIAFPGLARAAWLVAKDKLDSERRLFVPIKNNLARRSQGMAFGVEEVEVPGLPGRYPRLKWEAGAVEINADDALAPSAGDRGPSELDRAGGWLRDRLAGGAVAARKLYEAAAADGIAKRTLQRAKDDLGVRVKLRASGSERGWYWELPRDDGAPGGPPPAEADEPAGGDGVTGGLGAHGGLGDVGNLGGLGDLKKRGAGRDEERESQGGQERQGGQDRQGSHERQSGQPCQGGHERGVEGGVSPEAGAPSDDGNPTGEPPGNSRVSGPRNTLFEEQPACHDDGSEVGRHG